MNRKADTQRLRYTETDPDRQGQTNIQIPDRQGQRGSHTQIHRDRHTDSDREKRQTETQIDRDRYAKTRYTGTDTQRPRYTGTDTQRPR